MAFFIAAITTNKIENYTTPGDVTSIETSHVHPPSLENLSARGHRGAAERTSR
ncbi:hypothetical protein [Thalassiella azotivora]